MLLFDQLEILNRLGDDHHLTYEQIKRIRELREEGMPPTYIAKVLNDERTSQQIDLGYKFTPKSIEMFVEDYYRNFPQTVYVSHVCQNTDPVIEEREKILLCVGTKELWFEDESESQSYQINYCPYCGASIDEIAKQGGDLEVVEPSVY